MNFLELKNERKRVHSSPYEFFLIYYIDIHMVHERKKWTPFRTYISRAVNVGAELNVYAVTWLKYYRYYRYGVKLYPINQLTDVYGNVS